MPRSVVLSLAKCAVRRLLPSRPVSVRARALRAETLLSTHRQVRLAEGLHMQEPFVDVYRRATNAKSRISVAPSPVVPEGSSSSSSSKADFSSGKALRSRPSRSKQAFGVGAYACQTMVAV